MTITDAEFANAGARIEQHYLDRPDRYPELRHTRIDALGLARWPTDYYTLRASGLAHEPAIAEVERRMAAAVGEVTPPPIWTPVASLSLRGRLMYSGEAPFRWRGMTAFALLAMIARGESATASGWMQAARALGFNLFRVLAMGDWLKLSPAAGRAALPELCALSRELGVALEVVALADTAAMRRNDGSPWTDRDCSDQVRRVSDLVAEHLPGAGLVQAANEHYHDSQIAWLHSVANVDYLALQISPVIPGTASAAASDEATEPTGDYVTRHRDRSRDKWNNVRRIRELENVSSGTGRYVVDDEAIGFAEAIEPGRRETDPAIAFTQGVLARIFEVGSTFHCEAGLRCDQLGPVQQACARAFLEGSRAIPDDRVLHFQNANNPREDGSRPWPQSPVQDYDTSAAVRVYTGVAGDEGWTCALGLTGDPRVTWHRDWAPAETVAAHPGVTLWHIVHR